MNRGKDRNSGTSRVSRRRGAGAVAAAGLALAVLLAGCAQMSPVVAHDDPPVGAVADVAPENVKVETFPAYRDTVADARESGAVWQGTSKKPFARVSACTARLWKRQLPHASLQRLKAGAGQTLELSSKDDGVLAILDLVPHKPGSEGSLYLGATGPQSLADAVRRCL
ncbi:hypothetical protein [Pandoraea terrigena]|uniref:Uncharacterized protein n=1 Tax=Pandoraea terrigena TaxID=2508292 RepID=A0A5E4UW29_9BURK|nr:hypothetical protein [Pandoraea terrigena]VVE04106.1 hypothetical protein PTE31013_02296 [Pandoraea terrigena]